MSVKLVTHATRAYIPRTAGYLASLNRHWPWDAWFLTVDSAAPSEFMEQFPRIRTRQVPKVAGSPENTDSLQHGAFLDYVPGGDDDVLVYTDADIVMQRGLTVGELTGLERLPPQTVACGWNSGPGETLAIEGARLFPRGDIAAAFGTMVNTAPCYNIGVIAARRDTWRDIYTAYMENWADCLALFGAQQRQQWLVCWAIAAVALTVEVMPYSMHMHGCYPLPAGGAINGQATFNGEPVLFRHHC